MRNLTFDEILNADFRLYENNPIIRNFGGSFVVADPSVLTPAQSHDKLWHLFCHTFFGVYRFDSKDGINFHKVKRIVPRAMRPNINYIDGKYYLFYERTKTVIGNALSLIGGKWRSEIYVTESKDLNVWTEPRRALGFTREFESDERGQAISNPFLLHEDNFYRLYYSCGQTYLEDCKFCEPTYISYAESKEIADGYVAAEQPIISPDKNNPYLNLCSGCLKVYRIKDCYIGLQNGIFDLDGKSRSAIMLMKSDDGKKFTFEKMLLEPQKCGKSDWMAQFVYACHLVYHNGKLRLYFNARNTAHPLKGRESIGIYEADMGSNEPNKC